MDHTTASVDSSFAGLAPGEERLFRSSGEGDASAAVEAEENLSMPIDAMLADEQAQLEQQEGQQVGSRGRKGAWHSGDAGGERGGPCDAERAVTLPLVACRPMMGTTTATVRSCCRTSRPSSGAHHCRYLCEGEAAERGFSVVLWPSHRGGGGGKGGSRRKRRGC